jgi:hypothetical protein
MTDDPKPRPLYTSDERLQRHVLRIVNEPYYSNLTVEEKCRILRTVALELRRVELRKTAPLRITGKIS